MPREFTKPELRMIAQHCDAEIKLWTAAKAKPFIDQFDHNFELVKHLLVELAKSRKEISTLNRSLRKRNTTQ